MSSGTNRVPDARLDEILAFCNDNGEPKACEQFGINIETLHRYQRERRWRDTRNPKILLLDIETARMIVGTWRLGKQRVGHEQVIHDWFMFGWSAKWLFSAEIMSDFLTAKEAIQKNDERVCKSIWKLVDEADIVIAHNGSRSDVPRLNARFILNGLKPPMPYLLIDTCKIAYKNFSFASSALNYLGKILLSKEKLHTDYDLWIRCENGDQDALDYMEKYCKEDTALLEEVYLEIRGWIKSHPNLAVLMDAKEQCCPNCGSFEFEEGEGYYTTPQNRYTAVRCKSCGAPNRKKESLITTEQRKVLLVPNAR